MTSSGLPESRSVRRVATSRNKRRVDQRTGWGRRVWAVESDHKKRGPEERFSSGIRQASLPVGSRRRWCRQRPSPVPPGVNRRCTGRVPRILRGRHHRASGYRLAVNRTLSSDGSMDNFADRRNTSFSARDEGCFPAMAGNGCGHPRVVGPTWIWPVIGPESARSQDPRAIAQKGRGAADVTPHGC